MRVVYEDYRIFKNLFIRLNIIRIFFDLFFGVFVFGIGLFCLLFLLFILALVKGDCRKNICYFKEIIKLVYVLNNKDFL